MTREEAIECVQSFIDTFEICKENHEPIETSINGEDVIAFKMAIKALQEPKYCDRNICIQNEYNGIGCDECEVTKSQESCEDAISRQAVLDALEKAMCEDGFRSETGLIHKTTAYEIIRHLPSVTPQPKTGHWNKMVLVYDVLSGEYKRMPYTDEDEKFENVPVYICKCGCEAVKPHNYCPDCGLKMQEVSQNKRKGD